MLAWARGEAGYTVDNAAEQLGLSPLKLVAWENNEVQPTLRQAEALAKLYEFSFSIFSLPEPPKTTPLAAEYRRLPGVKPGDESPQMRKAIRRLVRRRRLALHLVDQLSEEAPEFQFRCKLDENPEVVGARLRHDMGVSMEAQIKWSSEFVAFRAWRMAAENMGVLVCQFSGTGLPEMRGTSIVNFPLPVVAVSSKEIPLSKPFTLLHEMVHLGLAATNEEGTAAQDDRPEGAWLDVERFCERAVAAALMPEEYLQEDPDIRSAVLGDNVDAVRRMSRRYKVTPSAIATRLLWLNLMSRKNYLGWKSIWRSYCDTHPPKPGYGIATPAEKAVTRAGPYFTSLVLTALSGERISAADASNYLGVSFDHVETIRQGWIAMPSALAGVTQH